MLLLALTVQAEYPALNVRSMHQGRFAKFLEIPPEATVLDVLIEVEGRGDGGVCARLLTRIQLQTMARVTTHCELAFTADSTQEDKAVKIWPPCCIAPEMEVSAEQVYRHLVPFGPAYRTLQGQLFLGKDSARGTLQAPNLPLSSPNPVGSPFPLDGAMHAACVHGQRLVNFVPFPVGFARRTIRQPTRAGERYHAHVHLQSQVADELVYDLQILDYAEQVRETVRGLRMRDVSGGRIKPPAWIQSAPVKAC